MYLTVKEASQFNCIGPETCGDQLRASPLDPPRRVCTGSECAMAWRWAIERIPGEPNVLSRQEWGPSLTHGYCGLAGTPAVDMRNIPDEFGPFVRAIPGPLNKG